MKLLLAILVLLLGKPLSAQLPPFPPGLSANSAKAVAQTTNGFFVVSNPAPAVTFTWTASPSPGVAGYNFFWGVGSRQYTNFLDAGNALTATVSNLAFGATYYFAATAYVSNGLQSAFSTECTNTMPMLPSAPGSVAMISLLAANSLNGPWLTSGPYPVYVGATNQATFFKVAISKQ